MFRCLLSFLLLCQCSNAGAQAISAQLYKRVFILDNPPFESCHASTITPLKGDKLMAAWFAGKHEGSSDVGIWTAVYENGKWGSPVEVANGIVNDTLRYPCWNPVLFRTRAGKLLLFYKVGKSPRDWWGMMMTSTNNGKRWSAPERLPDGMLGPIKNKPMQLENGDILYPSSTESADEKAWHIHLERSDRDGRNWSRIAIDNDTFGVIQPSILRYGHDSLQLLCRSRQNYVVQSWSADNGASWGPLSPTNLPNPNSGTDAVTLKNGLQLIVYNPLYQGREWWEGRSRLYVAASEDGRNWQHIFSLENQPDGEYSYPAIIQAEKGLVHITYTAERKNIRHVILHIAKKEN
ncbi:exo-alpha-sialidase [Chitinophaga sp. XS-30]|uniref:sialidase family protein n=1 Tax=Chitinophaga sp. XS-30 TaxID=2604421 RepID=UPI0011DD7C0C|nr:sialidase family protein [Chitinophaga sp. XS-30]QEH42059.1 sialidase [Chitinophaga sp. XS-30]